MIGGTHLTPKNELLVGLLYVLLTSRGEDDAEPSRSASQSILVQISLHLSKQSNKPSSIV
jgi:hypothetical protein